MGFALPAGAGTLGRSDVSFKWNIQQVIFQPSYGVTDELSVGMNIPYYWMRNAVNAKLDSSTATLGINPFVPGGIAPIGFAGTPTPTAEDIQDLLVSQGFKRVETWSYNGVGDIEAGFKYRYFTNDNWRFAFTGGARFPTGRVDDPDNLVDRGFGSGAYALLFRLQQDFVLQPDGVTKSLGFPDPGSLLVNATFSYDLFLPDRQKLRICDVHNPICPFKENVKRNLGDIVRADVSLSYGFWLPGLFLSPQYQFGHSFKDHYSGDRGLDYGALEEETDWIEHVFVVGLTYTTLPLVLENKFPIPLTATVSYRDRFAGDNNVFVSKFIGFNLQVYF